MGNFFERKTSREKLRGEYYTPPELVRIILKAVDLRPDDVVLDPTCGDGGFLVGAVRYLAERVPAGDRAAMVRQLPQRLIGLDSHPEAVSAARSRVRQAFHGGFGVDLGEEDVRVYERSALDSPSREALQKIGLPPGRLLVVGNPPYVEAKRLPAPVRAELRRRYPAASTGAPDLYLYVLHACLNWLEDADRLAFVLPNRVLVNANAREVRRRLLEESRLRGIHFASRAGLFPGAAVYPVVLYAGAEQPGSGTLSLARVERRDGSLEALELPSLPVQSYQATTSLALFPVPDTDVLSRALLRLVEQVQLGRLDDVLDIRWTISFHRRGLREQYVTPHPNGSSYVRKILGGGAFSGNGEVSRYRLRWGGWWIDYDLDRLRADGNPLPAPDLFAPPRIVICQNGRTLRAAYDATGYALKDVFLCGVPLDSAHPLARHPRALVGLLCSRAIHFFYAHVFHGGHVNGGYLHFLRSFLVDVPLGEWSDETAEELAALVERREQAEGSAEQQDLEEEIEARVSAALGITPGQREAIRGWAEADENWQARERIRRCVAAQPEPADERMVEQ